jgi:hypothetical protein
MIIDLGNGSNDSSKDWRWPFWPTLPIYPFGQRRTLRREIVRDRIWIFEQLQGILYVVTPIRMTVIKLEAGGLLVYAPVAPTRECLRLLQDLIDQYGEVKYIVLPTVSGLEHKVFVGPFARRFPRSQVWVAPHQWSFPLNLPLSWLGLPANRTRPLPLEGGAVPFAEEFEYAILGPIQLGIGPFEEVALWHKPSQTLLLTDTVVAVPAQPPEIVTLNPYPLLFHGRDQAAEPVQDTPANRLKGWQRIVLFSFYFRPSALDIVPWKQAFQDAQQSPDRSRRNYFGLFPFHWRTDWQRSFEALWGEGRLFVAPILQTLILNRAPQETIDWADRVASWNFQQIIPCHLAAPIVATPAQFRSAFTFLEKQPFCPSSYPLPEPDFALLREIEATLNQRNITPPAKGKI